MKVQLPANHARHLILQSRVPSKFASAQLAAVNTNRGTRAVQPPLSDQVTRLSGQYAKHLPGSCNKVAPVITSAPTEIQADQRIAFCSLASDSHRPQAQLCLDSLRLLHPQATCLLLEIDEPGDKPSVAGQDVLRLQDCIAADRLAAMRQRYSLAELCFAAKPYLLRKLLAAGYTQVHYLDGDCLAYAPLTPLIDQLDQAGLLLTPHSLAPIPDDGQTPRPLTLLRAGVFNAGYLGVRNSDQGLAFVDWLCEMTAEHAKNAPREGMCGDQRWLDLAPVLFPGLAICRHRGANVAYWNLHERAVDSDSAGGYTAAGEPLLFFHFSGLDPAQPLDLSRYQSRTRTREHPALAALLQDYARRLQAAGFHVAPTPRSWRQRIGFSK